MGKTGGIFSGRRLRRKAIEEAFAEDLLSRAGICIIAVKRYPAAPLRSFGRAVSI